MTRLFIRSDSNHMTPTEWVSALMGIAKQKDNHPADGLMWAGLAASMKYAQVFDFGVIEDKLIAEEAKRGGKLWAMGHLDVPYQSCIYRYRSIPDEAILAQVLEENPDDNAFIQARLAAPHEYCTIFMKGPDKRIFAADFIRMDEYRDTAKTCFCLASACIGGADQLDPTKWKGHSVSSQLCVLEYGQAMGSVMDGVIGLSMMLSTKNIKLRVEEASPKLNKKRAASGKPPLPTVTFVNASHYFEAMHNTAAKGTHASPVPHLRRGHLRTYETGLQIWIRDTIVNARSISEIQRDHYEVRA